MPRGRERALSRQSGDLEILVSASPAIPQSERLKFPGLLPAEIVVIRAWLRLHESEYERFDYNVRIGAGVEPPAGTPEYLREMAIQNTQKRLDAVAWRGGVPTIVEVKERAVIAAVGQLAGYFGIWLDENRPGPVPKLILVCNRAEPDVFTAAAHLKISVELVAVPAAELAAAHGA